MRTVPRGDVIDVPSPLPALLRLALLPWEDAGELGELLAGLITEFGPRTTTERHVVEQLALAMWRKRRVVQTERALHLATLRQSVDPLGDSKVAESALVLAGPVGGMPSVHRALWGNPARDGIELAALDADATRLARALRRLRRGGDDAYARALAALPDDTRAWWADRLAGEDDPDEQPDDDEVPLPDPWTPTAADLLCFLERLVAPALEKERAQLRQHQALRDQAHGQSLDPDRAARLQACDVRLDRQIERHLAMLIKLQGRAPARQAIGEP